MRFIQLCVTEPSYPRNMLMRQWLQANSHAVVVHNFDNSASRTRRFAHVFLWTLKHCRRGDVLILTELNNQHFLPARIAGWIKGSRGFWVDFFVGMYETNIQDWEESRPNSAKAHLYRTFDEICLRYSTVVTTDTSPRAKALQRRKSGSIIAIPVGGPSWAMPKQHQVPAMSRRPLQLLFYAKLSPLHGHEFMLSGLKESLNSGIDWQLTAILSGDLQSVFRERVEQLGLSERVEYVAPVVEAELSAYLDAADATLGIFGDSPKAAGVFPNKVWQGLLCGRPVLTRTSTAYGEWRSLVPTLLHEIAVGSPDEFVHGLQRASRAVRTNQGTEEAQRLLDRFQEVYSDALTETVRRLNDDLR